MRDKLKDLSKEIESNYQDNFDAVLQANSSIPIEEEVLQRRLQSQQHPLMSFLEGHFQGLVKNLTPFYAVTQERLSKNLISVLKSEWQFELPQDELLRNCEQKKSLIRMSHYKLNLPSSQYPESKLLSERSSRVMESSLREVESDAVAAGQQNKYNSLLLIWGPITLAILTHLIHNHPFSTSSGSKQGGPNIDVFAGALIDLGLIVLSSFLMFVFFKVNKTEKVQGFFQHICLASYVGVVTVVYSLSCGALASFPFLLLILTLAFILGSTYLHVNAYNRAIQPNLAELALLTVILLVLYTSAGFMFYQYLHIEQIEASSAPGALEKTFVRLRTFLN